MPRLAVQEGGEGDATLAATESACLIHSMSMRLRCVVGRVQYNSMVVSHCIYLQVRKIVGCLVEVGAGGMPASDIPLLLRPQTLSPEVHVPTTVAPAHGLYLMRTFVPDCFDLYNPRLLY